MKHLSDEELLDLLFEEPQSERYLAHVEQCQICREKLDLLEDGLAVANLAHPSEVDTPMPPTKVKISHWKKIGYIAAAVFILFSFLGMKIEIHENRFSAEFALIDKLFGTDQSDMVSREDFEALEERVIGALNDHSQMTASEMNRHFESLQESQHRELMELSIQWKDSFISSELETGEQLAILNRDLKELKNGVQSGERQ
ncbi:MAG: hypothetical protein CR997_04375 [Acidobacteria bacterium]|nr:MAG: hypothetical protein CR997_04375 [Acidobacteriota bacterium]